MKKKILFRIGSLQAGGAERMLVDILNNLDYNLFDVTLLLNVKSGIFLSELNKKITLKYLFKELELPFISKHLPIVSKIIRTFKHLIFSNFPFLIHKFILKRNSYDTVIFFLQDLAYTHGFIKSENKVIWVHAILSEMNNKKSDLKNQINYFKHFNKIIAISNEVKNDLISIDKTISDKIEVIYNPLNFERIKELSTAYFPSEFKELNNKLKIISIGRITPSKGFERLIALKQKLDTEKIEAEIFIIGQTENKEFFNQLKKKIKEAGVSIHFLGIKENPYPYIKNANIVIQPSIHEGFGLVIAESLILNTPIIACELDAYKEFANNEIFYVANNYKEFATEALKAIKKISLGERKRNLLNTNIADIKDYVNQLNTIF